MRYRRSPRPTARTAPPPIWWRGDPCTPGPAPSRASRMSRTARGSPLRSHTCARPRAARPYCARRTPGRRQQRRAAL
eukprot:scaffold123492_cov63-Phaeocystis_antarctica.AAC.2